MVHASLVVGEVNHERLTAVDHERWPAMAGRHQPYALAFAIASQNRESNADYLVASMAGEFGHASFPSIIGIIIANLKETPPTGQRSRHKPGAG
jgi:hypothetical protein